MLHNLKKADHGAIEIGQVTNSLPLERRLTKGRAFLILVGTFCVTGGGWRLLSDLIFNINGVHTTAVLIDRSVDCALIYMPGGGGKLVNRRMPCERAIRFQKRNAPLRIDVSKQTSVQVEYDRGDGILRQLKVKEYIVKADKSRIGERIDIVYNAAVFDDIRYAVSWQTIKKQLLTTAIGLLAFISLNPAGFVHWIKLQLRLEQDLDQSRRERLRERGHSRSLAAHTPTVTVAPAPVSARLFGGGTHRKASIQKFRKI